MTLIAPAATETATIVVLSTPSCQRCKLVARRLDSRGIAYEYVDVTDPDNAEWADEMRDRGLKNVPQTIAGDIWIEGFDPDAIDRLF